jgi:hypothetical protein
MQALKDYVAQKNRWNAIFKGAQLDLSVPADRQKIADMLDSDLSPENLSCDGEVRGTALRNKYRALTTAATQLIKLDPSVKFYEFSA